MHFNVNEINIFFFSPSRNTNIHIYILKTRCDGIRFYYDGKCVIRLYKGSNLFFISLLLSSGQKIFFLMRKNFFSVPPMRICPNGQKSQEKNLPQEALALFFILFLLNSFLLSLFFLFPTFFHLLFNFLPCIYSLFSPFLLFKQPPIARFPWLWLAPPPGGWWRWTWALPRCRGTGGRRRRNHLGRRKKKGNHQKIL